MSTIPEAPQLSGLEQIKPALDRAVLITRLSAAAGLLRGAGYKDSSVAVLEAIEVIRVKDYAEYVHQALHPEAVLPASLHSVKQRLAEFDAMFPPIGAADGDSPT